MNLRKNMAEYFERTGLADKQPARFDLDHMIKEKAVHKPNRKHRSSPTNSNAFKLENKKTKSSSLHRSLSSRVSSNRSSRKSSPGRHLNKPFQGFKEKVLKTINDLVKIRNLKMKKNLEYAGREIAVIRKLKKMVVEEIKHFKEEEERRVAERLNEKLNEIAKRSAEELFLYEQKAHIITEENRILRNKIERLGKKNWLGIKKIGIEDCLNELSDKASDHSTMLIAEPIRSESYLTEIQKLSEGVMAELQQKDLSSLTGVLVLQLSRERMLHEQKKREMKETLNGLKSSREGFESLLEPVRPLS